MRKLSLILCGALACAHGKPQPPSEPTQRPPGTVLVEDALHGVRYDLPPSPEAWQSSHEGNAHVAGGVQVEVASFPMARETTAQACRDFARSKLSGRAAAGKPAAASTPAQEGGDGTEDKSGEGAKPGNAANGGAANGSSSAKTGEGAKDRKEASRGEAAGSGAAQGSASGNGAPSASGAVQGAGETGGLDTESPREQASGDSPTATWSFTRGAVGAAVRSRWAFYARGADCVMLEVSGPRGDAFSDKTFEAAARSFQVLPLPPERQREVDLLAGMGFLERRDPAAALERFEALTKREPDFAKAHFGALMAGFELGEHSYARALPHGVAALRAEHDLTAEQRQLALRAVGVMQLAENDVHRAVDTLAELVVRAPDLAEGQYNYSCALARSGDTAGALEHLRAAVRLDADLVAHARDDDDLKSLRSTPAFQQLLSAPPAAASKPPHR